MRNPLVVALGAVLLVAGQLVAVGPAAAQTASEKAQLGELQSWLAEIAVWTQGYDALTTSRVDTLVWLLDSADVLMSRLETGGAGTARPWATNWAVQARARLASEVESFRAQSINPPIYPSSVPTTPDMSARIVALGQTPAQIGTLMGTTGQACEDYIRVIEAAASGKPGDLARVDSARLGLIAAHLEAENIMVTASTGGLDGPNLHFAHSQVASNRGLIVWLGHNKQLFAGQPVDGAATARGIRGHAATMRTAAAAMRTAIDALEVEMETEAGTDQAPLVGLLEALLASLRQSADVEAKLADTMDQLAVAVLSQDETADDVVAASIERLVEQRIALYTARLELTAQAGR